MMLEIMKQDAAFHRKKFFARDSSDIRTNLIGLLRELLIPTYRLVFIFRIYSSMYRSKWRILKYIALYIYLTSAKRYSSDIHPAAVIGVPFKLGHHFGIVIGPGAIIGKGVYVFNGVTIGNKWPGMPNAMPKIGDNVLIGTGAKLLGPIEVGDNSVIGANAVLTSSVQASSLWAGVPAKFIGNVTKR